MPILDHGAEVINPYTFYDSFRIFPGAAGRFSLFQEPLSAKKSMLETNMWDHGCLPDGQSFFLERFNLEFLNFPMPWDQGEFIRKTLFEFSVNRKNYFTVPVRDVVEPSSVRCPQKIQLRDRMPFEVVLIATNLNLDPQGPGLCGRVLMHGQLTRSIL